MSFEMTHFHDKCAALALDLRLIADYSALLFFAPPHLVKCPRAIKREAMLALQDIKS
jgi:hypothetical protein